MMPSRLMLMIPARSTTVSPIAAKSRGLVVRTVASRNVPAALLMLPGSRCGRAAKARALECNEQQDDRCFDDRHYDRGYARIALHRARPSFERSEQDARHDDERSVEPREECDGDRGIAIPRRNVLV